MHYFVKDIASINNLVGLVDALLPSGGRFIFTCLNGKTVFDLLKNKDGWSGISKDIKRYFIKSANLGKKFIGGEEIDILLPFSNNELYQESLVNLELVEKCFKKKKIMLESQANFGDIYLEQFKELMPDMYNNLDTIDFDYIKLISFSIYFKK